MKYAQKECYDCLGVFPGNEVRRIRFTQYGGESETQGNPDSTRVHLRTREAFLCRDCSAKRQRKSLLKWTAIVAAAAAVILYVGLGDGRSGKAEVAKPVKAMLPKPSVQTAQVAEADVPSSTSAATTTAMEASKAIPNSRFFDLENNSIVDAKCDVTIDGISIARGDCTVNTKDDRAIVFSNSDGCTVDVTGNGMNGEAELTAYRDLCPALDSRPEPITNLPLGKVSRRGDCWINEKVTICARP